MTEIEIRQLVVEEVARALQQSRALLLDYEIDDEDDDECAPQQVE
jgi:hypothetical protein